MGKAGFSTSGDVNFSAVDSITQGKVIYDDPNSVNISSNAETTIRNRAFAQSIDKDLINIKTSPVILRLQHSSKVNGVVRFGTHFVIAIGKCGDKYVISDPASLVPSLLDPNATILLNANTDNRIGPVTGIRRFRRSD